MIIVTGIGRCGTSMMAKFLKEAGMNIGADRWYEPINAGLENRQTLDINNRIINKYVKGQDINMHHVRGDIAELHYDAVKDPQFLVTSKVIETWWETRQDLKVVFMERNPLDIVDSIRKHPEWNTRVYRTDIKMIEQKVGEFKKTIRGLMIPTFFFLYPDDIADGDTIDNLCEFLGIETDTQLWNKVCKI